jgi:hypothetical protein
VRPEDNDITELTVRDTEIVGESETIEEDVLCLEEDPVTVYVGDPGVTVGVMPGDAEYRFEYDILFDLVCELLWI